MRIVVIEAVVVGPASADAVSAALVGGVVVVLVVAVDPHVNAKSRPADSMGFRVFPVLNMSVRSLFPAPQIHSFCI